MDFCVFLGRYWGGQRELVLSLGFPDIPKESLYFSEKRVSIEFGGGAK